MQDLDGDRLGLIAFAGRSYILTPLTVDGGAVSLYLDGLDPDLASEGGTDLAATLNQGLELLEATTEISDRVLVVFTDGETHDSLSARGGRGRGHQEGGDPADPGGRGRPRCRSRFPIRDPSGRLIEYKLDQDGQVVETSLPRVGAARGGGCRRRDGGPGVAVRPGGGGPRNRGRVQAQPEHARAAPPTCARWDGCPS